MMIYQTLDDIKRDCINCQKCALAQTRTNVVFGKGNAHARVLFIGEGPGEQEDLKGEPFVGRSGKLLDEYLKLIDLDRKTNIYIGNMVKCRPPQNRDPKPEEQDICMDWLRAQTKVINPDIIVCVGRIAAQRIISPDFRVTKEHGQFIKKGNIWMMGTFHPAALLRNPRQKPDALSDFQALREKIFEVCPETYQM